NIHVFTDSGRLGAGIFVNFGELVSIAKVDERHLMSRKMKVDAAVLVVILWIGRSISIRKPKPARIAFVYSRIVPCIITLASVRSRPMRIFELRRVHPCQPTMSVRRHSRFEIEVIAKRKP